MLLEQVTHFVREYCSCNVSIFLVSGFALFVRFALFLGLIKAYKILMF